MIMTNMRARRDSLSRISCSTKDINKIMKNDSSKLNRRDSLSRKSPTPKVNTPVSSKSRISSPTISAKQQGKAKIMNLNSENLHQKSVGSLGDICVVRSGGFQVIDSLNL